MKKVKDFVRSITPSFALEAFRSAKKKQTRRQLAAQKAANEGLSLEQLVSELKAIGVTAGDTLLVHSSLSKLGYVEGGPATVVQALLNCLGAEGNLLFPTSPAAAAGKDHLEAQPFFDLLNTPSRMGAITEYFRKMEGVQRSFHPTEAVAAFGPDAVWLTQDHFGELTPYNSNSPFARVAQKRGKILMIGTTLDNSGTNLHTLEDAVDQFKYPVYDEKVYEVDMIDANGEQHRMKTKVHSKAMAARRRCDELLPLFERENVVSYGTVGAAKCLFLDAHRMLEVMIEQYEQNGITMYTPHGEELAL